jgi:hypothetical protein
MILFTSHSRNRTVVTFEIDVIGEKGYEEGFLVSG